MTNTPMTSREEPKMLGNVSTDELVEMGKTHPLSALTIAYSEGAIVGINKAKAQQASVIAELVEALERAIGRIEDMLMADDGQAWKETERALPVLKEVLAKHKGQS